MLPVCRSRLTTEADVLVRKLEGAFDGEAVTAISGSAVTPAHRRPSDLSACASARRYLAPRLGSRYGLPPQGLGLEASIPSFVPWQTTHSHGTLGSVIPSRASPPPPTLTPHEQRPPGSPVVDRSAPDALPPGSTWGSPLSEPSPNNSVPVMPASEEVTGSTLQGPFEAFSMTPLNGANNRDRSTAGSTRQRSPVRDLTAMFEGAADKAAPSPQPPQQHPSRRPASGGSALWSQSLRASTDSVVLREHEWLLEQRAIEEDELEDQRQHALDSVEELAECSLLVRIMADGSPHTAAPGSVHLTDQWDESETQGLGKGEGQLRGSTGPRTASTVDMRGAPYGLEADLQRAAEAETSGLSSGKKLVRNSSRLAVSSNAWDSEEGTVEWNSEGRRPR